MLLVECGASQLPSGAPLARQSVAAVGQTVRVRSWMLPEAHHWVFSYPQGKLVGEITGFNAYAADGLCTDREGDVFVAADGTTGGFRYKALTDPTVYFIGAIVSVAPKC